jgi:MOSC domain-containing protein YiiM
MAMGRVASLNVSRGGVPKLPIESALVGELGLEGDRHRARMHGGPTAALCLFSLEVIERLRREGHPIHPGALGENLTVEGLDWAALQPGDRLRIGPVVVELTRFTAPCKNVAGAFWDGDFSRVDARRHPGEARLYARVVETGLMAVGDAVEHLPSRPS